MSVWYTTMPSPIDELLLTGDGEALTGLHMVVRRHDPAGPPDRRGDDPRGDDRGEWRRDDRVFAAATSQLAAYFAGELTEFDLRLAPSGTEFQRRVWAGLQTIPYGETTSYGELAAQLGNAGASRAVGLANGRNPIGIVIPCHRVIGSDGRLTGYGGGLDRKRWLLDHEQAVLRRRGDLPVSAPAGLW
jgi:methylated-DNA-[protein]-cysteine S-methyltransferase